MTDKYVKYVSTSTSKHRKNLDKDKLYKVIDESEYPYVVVIDNKGKEVPVHFLFFELTANDKLKYY